MRIHPGKKQESGQRLDELGLASAVAHEVRRLLTPARAYAEMALAGPPLSSEASQAVVAILRATEDCESILEALVSGGGTEDSNAADVGAIAHRIDESLSLDIGVGSWVAMSPARLQIVLSNLVANAKRASKDSTSISISCCSTGNTAQIRVADRGVGMSPRQLSDATKPFVSFSSGSGLGLAICKHLVEEAGGRMWIASAEGCGTSVTLELPAATAELKKSA